MLTSSSYVELRNLPITRQSTPQDELLDRIRHTDDTNNIVIMDEANQFQDLAIPYDLHLIRNISIILIANLEKELLTHADDWLNNRLVGSKRVEFSRYTEHELVSVLENRAERGLTVGTIDTAGLRRIAVDARAAIGILRNAAETAAFESVEFITESISDARDEIHRQTIDRLTPSQ